MASFSTFIQNNPTTEASLKFKNFISEIDENLEQVLQALENSKSDQAPIDPQNNQFAKEQLPSFVPKNIELSSRVDLKLERELQEAHLVTEQLHWLFSLSGKMLRLVSKIEFD